MLPCNMSENKLHSFAFQKKLISVRGKLGIFRAVLDMLTKKEIAANQKHLIRPDCPTTVSHCLYMIIITDRT
jgi:hypothetical protein